MSNNTAIIRTVIFQIFFILLFIISLSVQLNLSMMNCVDFDIKGDCLKCQFPYILDFVKDGNDNKKICRYEISNILSDCNKAFFDTEYLYCYECTSPNSYYYRGFNVCFECTEPLCYNNCSDDKCSLCEKYYADEEKNIVNEFCLRCVDPVMIIEENKCTCPVFTFYDEERKLCISCKIRYDLYCTSCNKDECLSCLSPYCSYDQYLKTCLCSNEIMISCESNNNFVSGEVFDFKCYCYNGLGQCVMTCDSIYSRGVVACDLHYAYFNSAIYDHQLALLSAKENCLPEEYYDFISGTCIKCKDCYLCNENGHCLLDIFYNRFICHHYNEIYNPINQVCIPCFQYNVFINNDNPNDFIFNSNPLEFPKYDNCNLYDQNTDERLLNKVENVVKLFNEDKLGSNALNFINTYIYDSNIDRLISSCQNNNLVCSYNKVVEGNICSGYKYLKCLKCDPHLGCIECKKGYYIYKGELSYLITKNEKIVQREIGECYHCRNIDHNCLDCDEKTCYQCKRDYVINELGICSRVKIQSIAEFKRVLDDGLNQVDPQYNCTISNCLLCPTYFNENTNKTVSYCSLCDEKSYLNTRDFTCSKLECEVPNCLYCGMNNVCVKCKNFYELRLNDKSDTICKINITFYVAFFSCLLFILLVILFFNLGICGFRKCYLFGELIPILFFKFKRLFDFKKKVIYTSKIKKIGELDEEIKKIENKMQIPVEVVKSKKKKNKQTLKFSKYCIDIEDE